MPRRKQSHPQPVKLGCEDGAAAGVQENLVLESNFLLEQELAFGESDYRIIGFERDTDVAGVGIQLYSFSDEECSGYRLGLESDFEDPRDTESEREEAGPEASCGGAPERQGGGRSSGGAEGNPGKTFSCKLCSFSSRYSNHLTRHMKTHNGEKPFRCQHCGYASAQRVNLQRHQRTHTGEKPYQCPLCAFACSSLGNLKRHQRMHAPREGEELRCSRCDFHASSRQSLKKHASRHAAEPAATDLTLQMGSDSAFFQSYQAPPTGADPLPELLFPFTCRVCGAVLDEEEEAGDAQVCGKCALEAPPPSPAKDDKPHACPSCPFVTRYPNHLTRHTRTHSGEKPYRCPHCSYASAHYDNLKRHQRVHTGEKPYQCPLCDYACGNLANLKRHQRVHSGAKPFQCGVCSYSCNQSMNLKRHMLRHTGHKPYHCPACRYTTGHWDNYKRHQKKHGQAW